MNFHAIGDLAQSLALRRQSATVQARLGRLSAELSSGQTSDVTEHLGGSVSQLSDVEHRITLNAANRTASSEADVQAGAMQRALEQVRTQLGAMSDTALSVANAGGGASLDAAATVARGGLDAIISALNTDVSGRALFSGTSVQRAPLASSDELMAELRTALGGAPDADAVATAIDTFFDTPGGGFDAAIYRGGTQDLAPFRLGNGESVQLSIRADDPAVRGAMKDAAMAALAGDAALTLADADRLDLMRRAGGNMRGGIDRMARVQADLGVAEGRIAQSSARIAAERTSLQVVRNEMLSVDRFETASALEEAQFQLEAIYTLTARTARLNLVNFL